MRARWQALTPAHAAAASPYLPPQDGLAPTAAHSVCVLIRHLHLFPRRAAASDKTFSLRPLVCQTFHSPFMRRRRRRIHVQMVEFVIKSWWAFFSPPSRGRNSHTWLPEDFPGYNFNRFRFSWILCCNKTWQTYVLLVLFLIYFRDTCGSLCCK